MTAASPHTPAQHDAKRHAASRAVLVLVACALALAGGVSPAAAGEYRYWSYWQADGGPWRYATVGPGGSQPADGAVEGWRFLVSAEREGSPPRSAAVFDEICRGAKRSAGQKRVAVVIDYGTPADAPEGEQPPNPRTACTVVADNATGADVLAATAEPRFGNDALLCAIDGYPRTGCADPLGVSDGSAAEGGREAAAGGDRNVPRARPGGVTDDGGTRSGLLVGIALVLGLGAAAAWRARTARRT